MTTSTVVHTRIADAAAAGAELGVVIARELRGERPDALILFASPHYDLKTLLGSLHASCRPRTLVGASSAGEITSTTHGEGLACAFALRNPEMRFNACVGRALSADGARSLAQLVEGFRGSSEGTFAHRSALLLIDARARQADDFVEKLNAATGGTYRLFGDGAGGDANFGPRVVFVGTEAIPDAAVALEILSNKPLGTGVRQGWTRNGESMRITEADGDRRARLDAIVSAETFEEHAERTGKKLERKSRLPFFLRGMFGVRTEAQHDLLVQPGASANGAVALTNGSHSVDGAEIGANGGHSSPIAASKRRRESLTPTECPHCYGRSKIGCRLCGGSGVVSVDVADGYEQQRAQRLTGQLGVFEDVAQNLVVLLDARRTEPARKLAAEGMRLLEDFARARTLEPGDPRRSMTVTSLLQYQKAVLCYLAGNR